MRSLAVAVGGPHQTFAVGGEHGECVEIGMNRDLFEAGAVFVHGAALWLECKPFKTVDAGDHEIVVLAIEALLMNPDVDPMIFHRSGFHEILRSA